ncbi:ankyrin repeat ph and sec7 domain containing protein secg-related [Anaeramoeba ignava]|uniref:Ankyrin repeat ph and sec7 domain containing protein secg-related n=1 Tax=Anaeramoeba ignava TaxID=1746090 RepID=A0A9Q0LHV2_ANAIG|nr:ankyrin repeat ph and sec7 domain containing protein secg-related [Anaeramoeba ignava]
MDIFQAIQNNNIQFVQHFLLQNSDINAEYSTTLIHFACSCRPLSLDILKILIESGADLSRTDQRTPLHYLCSKKPDKQSLLYLLNAGSNVQVNRKDGNTPFHLACQSSCGEDILIILIQFGADNSIQNNQVPTDLTSQKNQQKIQKHFEKIQKGAISIEMISFNSVILKLQRGVNINYGILVIKDYENKQQFEEEFHVKNLQEFVKFEGLIPERKYYVYLNKSQKPIVSFKTKKIPTYQFIIQYIGFDSFCCVFLSKIYDPNDTEITTEIAPDHFYSKKMITYEKKRVTIRYENLNVGNLYELKFKILYRKFTHEIQGKETIKLQNADFEIFNTFSRKMNLFQDILEANYWNEEKILEVEKYFQQYQELEKKSKMDDLISLILSQDSISKISEKLDLWMSFYNAKQILVENMKEIVYPKNENDMNINKKGIFSQEMENYLFIKNFFEKFPKSQPNLEEEKENITGNDLNIKKSQNKMIEINSSKYNSIFDGWEKSISKVAIERMKIMEDRKKWTNLIETVNNQEKSKETILQNFQQCQFLVKNQQEFAAIDINIFLKYPKLKDLEFFEVVKMETQIKKQLFKFDSLLSKLKYLSEKIRKEIIKTCRRFLESPNKGNLTMNFGRNLNQNINLNVNLNLEQNSNQNSNQIVPLKERKKINFNIDFSSEDENDFKNICDSSDDYDVDENDDVEFDSTIESDSSDIDSYSSSGKIMSENELNMLISQREDLREKLGLFATQLKQDLKTVHSKMIKFSKELANGQNQEIVGISAPKPIITRPKNDILMKKMSENEIISEWGILTNLFTQIDKNITQTFNLIKNTFIHPSQNKIQEITTKNVEIQQLAKNCLSFQKEKKEILNQIFILYLKKQREFSQSVENIKKQMEKYESKFEEILLIIEKKKQKNNLQEMKQKIETEIGKYQKMMEKYQEEKKEAQFQEMKIEKIKLEKDKDQAEQKIQEICYNFYPEEAFHSFSPSVLIDLH